MHLTSKLHNFSPITCRAHASSSSRPVMRGSSAKRIAAELVAETKAGDAKIRHLAELDVFVLDNSIRESTVGQLKGHTIDNKKAIFNVCKSLNMPAIIVASFSHMHRVDDEFCRWLKKTGEDFSRLWSFSEVFAGKVTRGNPDKKTIPVALPKNKEFGLYNTIFEIDLADPNIAWDTKWTVKDTCKLLEKRMDYVYNNINPQANILLNFRDFPIAMSTVPERVLAIVEYLAKMPHDRRMFGLIYEDPMGESLPHQLAAWTRAMRSTMNANGWSEGHLLNHVHEKWELQTASSLECLSAGSDGVWASVCNEGAAMGHASSTVTLTNLIRLGNKKVLEKYNCKKLRQAAIEITKLTTMQPPHPKQCVYGARALDVVLDFMGVGDFNLGDFFGEQTEIRVSTLASPRMLKDRLIQLFGPDPQFTEQMGQQMKEKMLEDLNSIPPRKEEYQSAMGIALLFDRAGGQQTKAMADAIAKVEMSHAHHQVIIDEIRKEWDAWDAREEAQNDDKLEFDSFYHGFLQPYFGCYRCIETKQALRAIDMDNDGTVDWNEFLVFIKWALHEYPELTNADEVLDIAFTEGVIPAMADVKIRSWDLGSTSLPSYCRMT